MAAIKIGDFVKITFSSEPDTSISALETGTVCLLLQDSGHTGTYTVTNYNDIPTELDATNKDYIKQALHGKPRKVLCVVQDGSSSAVTIDTATFGVLETLNFDYLAIPGLSTGDATKVKEWAIGVNANPMHRFSVVLPNTDGDDMHIINYKHASVTVDGKALTTAQATPYVAGYLASTIPSRSMTMRETDAQACSAMTIAEIDSAGAAGGLVLFNAGKRVRFASDVNSLQSLESGQDESYQDILCVAVMDLFYNSVKKQLLEKYIGKFKNSYQNKLMLCGEIYQLLKEFEKTGLCEQGDTDVQIDVEAQTAYLREVNYKTTDGRGVSEMTLDEILRANTKKKVFLKVRMIPLGAIEAVEIKVRT